MLIHTPIPLSKAYGAQDLFTNVRVEVPRRARIGLVGANGSGKTTLLRILIGEEQPTEGRVERAKNLHIGYLPQNPEDAPKTNPKITLWEFVSEALAALKRLEEQLALLEMELGKPNHSPDLLRRYGALQAEYERRGGYTYHSRLRRVLQGMGFGEKDFRRPLAQLSGGQRTRAYLARLLLEEPDLLVLDEPTNHLDVQAIGFLEGYLKGYEGAVLFVSHDRYFLDQVAQVIWELSPHGLETYRGNYTAYVRERRRRWEERRARWDAEITRLFKDLDYIKRNIAGQNTAQAKGRLRRLSRAIIALEKGGLAALQSASWGKLSAELDLHTKPMPLAEAERRLRALRFPDPEPRPPRLRLSAVHRSGDIVLRTRNLEVGYPDADAPLFRVPDTTLRRGECAALIGANGAGKSTFLKTILGIIPPYRGSVELGASVHVGYFAQAAANLNPKHTVLQSVLAASPNLTPAEARRHLARYLFSADDLNKPIAALSGGERSRLALAQLALSGANFLLLDEPTNHLDIPAQEALQSLLADYDGTILLVTHDRYLVQALASQVWEVKPESAEMRIFLGGYEAYRAAAEMQTEDTKRTKPAPQKRERRAGLSKNERRKMERQIAEVEAQIGALEEELASLEAQLASPPSNPADVHRLGHDYAQKQEKLEALYARWEALHAALEQAESVAKRV